VVLEVAMLPILDFGHWSCLPIWTTRRAGIPIQVAVTVTKALVQVLAFGTVSSRDDDDKLVYSVRAVIPKELAVESKAAFLTMLMKIRQQPRSYWTRPELPRDAPLEDADFPGLLVALEEDIACPVESPILSSCPPSEATVLVQVHAQVQPSEQMKMWM